MLLNIESFFMKEGAHIAFAIGVLVVVVLFQIGINKLFKKITTWMTENASKYFKSIRFRNYEILTSERHLDLALKINTIVKWTVVIITGYITLPILFSIFPFTQDWAEILFDTVSKPIKSVALSAWHYLPNLFMIIVIFYCTRYSIKLAKFLADEVANGKLKIDGFHPEWAMPTLNIVKFLMYALMFIFIFPYLPGSDSPVFRSVSVIMGVLLSFGSPYGLLFSL